MNRRELQRLERDLTEYLDSMVAGVGRVERVAALRSYVTGLLLDGERKSIEPMAARLVHDAAEVQAMRQRLQQAVTVATWLDADMLRRLALKIDAEVPGIEALVLGGVAVPIAMQAVKGSAPTFRPAIHLLLMLLAMILALSLALTDPARIARRSTEPT